MGVFNVRRQMIENMADDKASRTNFFIIVTRWRCALPKCPIQLSLNRRIMKLFTLIKWPAASSYTNTHTYTHSVYKCMQLIPKWHIQNNLLLERFFAFSTIHYLYMSRTVRISPSENWATNRKKPGAAAANNCVYQCTHSIGQHFYSWSPNSEGHTFTESRRVKIRS